MNFLQPMRGDRLPLPFLPGARSMTSSPAPSAVSAAGGSPILAMARRAAELRAAGRDNLGLALGAPDFAPPADVAEAAIGAARRPVGSADGWRVGRGFGPARIVSAAAAIQCQIGAFGAPGPIRLSFAADGATRSDGCRRRVAALEGRA